MMGDTVIVKADFVVTGNVIGVGFRRSVKRWADSASIRGWVANTHSGKVVGTVEGAYDDVNNFKTWLAFKGPRNAVVESVTFNKETLKTSFDLPEGPFNVVYEY